jgi:hypothetical protein
VLRNERIASGVFVARNKRAGCGGIAAVAKRDCKVSPEPLHARALHRAAFQQQSQLIVRAIPQVEQFGSVETWTWLPLVIGTLSDSGSDVPRTHFLANVAPVCVFADRVAVFAGNRPFNSIVR